MASDPQIWQERENGSTYLKYNIKIENITTIAIHDDVITVPAEAQKKNRTIFSKYIKRTFGFQGHFSLVNCHITLKMEKQVID